MVVCTVVGCRPQFVKAALVCDEIESRGHVNIVIHSGQHYDTNMSDIFFKQLGIKDPDVFLDSGGLDHIQMIADMMIKLEQLLLGYKPDVVVVYGDTNTTLAAAIVSKRLGIKLAHVEAGLRSYNFTMPEEQNRVLVDSIADIKFAPTVESEKNCKGYLVGDVMYDMVKKYSASLSNVKGNYYLATIHRPVNTDNDKTFNTILDSLNSLDTGVVLPIHPRVKAKVDSNAYRNIKFVEPMGYIDMIESIKCAQKVITDSGGVQKEAFMLGVPCITLRDETEWKETVRAGANKLCKINKAEIINTVESWFGDIKCDCYGDGFAHEKIVDILERTCK